MGTQLKKRGMGGKATCGVDVRDKGVKRIFETAKQGLRHVGSGRSQSADSRPGRTLRDEHRVAHVWNGILLPPCDWRDGQFSQTILLWRGRRGRECGACPVSQPRD